ncbi:MAG: hypothetical protein WCV62_03805 [Candidatus Peribacteraceae bacterium]|jgi:hypothetical protein
MVNLLPVQVDADSESYVLVNQQEIPRGVSLKVRPDGLYAAEGDRQAIAELLQDRTTITSAAVRRNAPEAFAS